MANFQKKYKTIYYCDWCGRQGHLAAYCRFPKKEEEEEEEDEPQQQEAEMEAAVEYKEVIIIRRKQKSFQKEEEEEHPVVDLAKCCWCKEDHLEKDCQWAPICSKCKKSGHHASDC
jgi:hypothetical protein